MFTARLLLVLSPPVTADAAAETIARALKNSGRPASLRFAVPHTMETFLRDVPQGAEVIFYDAAQGLNGVVPCLSDETHFLCVTGPHAFLPRWDVSLHALWKKCGKQTLLTSSITPSPAQEQSTAAQNGETIRVPRASGAGRLAALRQMAPVLQKRAFAQAADTPRGILPQLRHAAKTVASSQAHLPALKDVQEDGSVVLGRGLALVCTDEPVRTLVIEPGFLFGPVTFLMEGEPLDAESLSLTAYLTGYAVMALPAVWAWPVQGTPPHLLRLPPAETLPGTTLARFEQLLGFHTSERRCAAKAAMGLFGHEDTYPQRMPGSLTLTHRLRSARMNLLEMHMPLMVSAFIDLPAPRVSPAFYLLRFGFLRRIQSLPLVLYTGGSQERALRASFPHTQSYPDNHLLPHTLLQNGMKMDEHFARSKTLLMHKAAQRQVEFTHAAWVDMDILPHPVCPEAVPDFSALMDDRIHIATVKGVPDPSFVVVPAERLPALTRLVQSVTQLDAELKRGFSEALLWERVFQRKPQWFAIHPMPRRRMLFMTAFDQQLLSRTLRPFLSDLPKAYYAAQDAGEKKSEKESPKS